MSAHHLPEGGDDINSQSQSATVSQNIRGVDGDREELSLPKSVIKCLLLGVTFHMGIRDKLVTFFFLLFEIYNDMRKIGTDSYIIFIFNN